MPHREGFSRRRAASGRSPREAERTGATRQLRGGDRVVFDDEGGVDERGHELRPGEGRPGDGIVESFVIVEKTRI